MAARSRASKKPTPKGVFITRNGKISFSFKDLNVTSYTNNVSNRKILYDAAWLLWKIHAKMPYSDDELVKARQNLLAIYFKAGGSADAKTKVTLTTGDTNFDE